MRMCRRGCWGENLDPRRIKLQNDGESSRRSIICIKYWGDEIWEVDVGSTHCMLETEVEFGGEARRKEATCETWMLVRQCSKES